LNIGSDKPVVLTFVNWYLPGFRGGGPTRSIANMVDRLGDEFDFRIVTMDRDVHDSCPYESIAADEWNKVGKAQVFYVSPTPKLLWTFSRLMRETPHDVLYLNSFFSRTFTLIPLLVRGFGRVSSPPVVIAPRGEFSEGALKLKCWKKVPFTRLARWLGLFDGVLWHASTHLEATDILRVVGATTKHVHVARNLSVAGAPSVSEMSSLERVKKGRQRSLHVCFLSRIAPMKNLDYALTVLAQVKFPIEFHIYGPKELPAYWQQCEALIAQLPSNVRVSYDGTVANSKVRSVIAGHDLFFVPSRGENFGHVFMEALSAGVPILVSDRTPWRGLREQKLGWDIPLDQPDAFVGALNEAAAFDESERAEMRARCTGFARDKANDGETVDMNRNIFLHAIGLNRMITSNV
jgi:glycosyltransferase involved in cell wall biosynthesis